ncbi:hypothetical protein KAK06_13350 [Ideonella sp. 4Y11]|uniref:Cytochrome P450 n=1 Tax=Ideonella aquatica TaxID=2824119 RepID=A0A940YQ40_9BURK|nr:hypothetical protein [Ideonella aquatica]MBQ0959933.1 hypothetical protein [Ideonella aquatica]
MRRHDRPPFDANRLLECLNQLPSDQLDEERNRRFFDHWCDPDDHPALITALRSDPCYSLPSRVHRRDDPAPPLGDRPPQGFRRVWLITDVQDIQHALTQPQHFSNLPYAELGGGAFLLARDPSAGPEHAEQQAFVRQLLQCQPSVLWAQAAERAVEQSALLALTQDDFDLAAWAGQAALRYMGIVFGFGFQDHGLLERSAQATYRALQYVAIGRHFVSEPATVPEGQRAVAALITRISALVEEYDSLRRAARRFGPPDLARTPVGVQPLDHLSLQLLGQPLLRQLPEVASPLSGHDRAMVCAMLIAGTLGNLQTAVCQVVDQLLTPGQAPRLAELREMSAAALAAQVADLVAQQPPLPVLPRRTIGAQQLPTGTRIPDGDDCLLLLDVARHVEQARAQVCAHAWGHTAHGQAAHPCLGKDLALPLITALVKRVLHLPGLARRIDPLTGDDFPMQRLWGVACTQLPLTYKRVRSRAQRNLIVSMRVKSPRAEHVAQLRRLIAAAVPRIEHLLTSFGGVHFAWFEFSDDDTQLILRTIYNGELEPYLYHFALRAGDLFDGLFEHLEDAPPHPVSAFPEEFIATVKRFNRAPLAGYLYSAYPNRDVPMCRR